jgi:hypothetical protein|tara:strand:+ start:179 stop:499 length:321 start_codon:yes stop_codon:yes gene_type:complete
MRDLGLHERTKCFQTGRVLMIRTALLCAATFATTTCTFAEAAPPTEGTWWMGMGRYAGDFEALPAQKTIVSSKIQKSGNRERIFNYRLKFYLMNGVETADCWESSY